MNHHLIHFKNAISENFLSEISIFDFAKKWYLKCWDLNYLRKLRELDTRVAMKWNLKCWDLKHFRRIWTNHKSCSKPATFVSGPCAVCKILRFEILRSQQSQEWKKLWRGCCNKIEIWDLLKWCKILKWKWDFTQKSIWNFCWFQNIQPCLRGSPLVFAKSPIFEQRWPTDALIFLNFYTFKL